MKRVIESLRIIGATLLSTWFLASAITISGQELLLSNIRGVITDPNGGVVAGATVELTNQNTGLSRTVQSDASGNYLFNNMVAGLYTVTVELSGFKKFSQTNIDLTASKTLRIDIVLEVGEISQTVTVTGETPLIETETPMVAFSARNEIMNRVPASASVQGGRIAHSFLYLIPGNVMSVDSASFNGLPSNQSASRITLDGIRVPEGGVQVMPTFEAIDEMKVVTHNASAEYATPSTVQVTTRQGGNALHGDVWELYGDKSLQARDPFLTDKSIFHGHQFGWSVGGAILKNKLFFYHGFEGFRFNNVAVTVSPNTPNNVPTTGMQQGDFSELLDPTFVNQFNRGQLVTVRDPLTGQPFSNNVIPANRISPVSTNFIKRFWTLPTAPGIVNNQFTNALRPTRRDRPDLRLDYIFSPRHTFFARFGYTHIKNAQPTVPFKPEDAGNLTQIWSTPRISLSDTFIFSPGITNEFRYGLMRYRLTFSSPYEEEDVMAAAGMQGTSGITGLPGLTYTGTGTFTGIQARSLTLSTRQVSGFTDNVSIFSGKHSIKAGIQFSRTQIFTNNYIGPPSFTFDGRLSGWSWADFILGLPSAVTRQLAPTVSYLFQDEWGFFVQDEIRATPNLTLQLGVRYQIWPYVHEKYDKLASFDLKRAAVVIPSEQARQFVVPTFPQDQIPILTATETGFPGRELVGTDFNNWAPRIGFAWRPFGKGTTVIRGGYGIYSYNAAGTVGPSPTQAVFLGSQTLNQQLGSGGTLVPTISFPNPFTGFQGVTGTLNPQTINFTAAVTDLKNPFVHEYSLTLEQEWRGWGSRFSYLGSLQNQIQHVVNWNEAPPGNLPFNQNRRPIPLVRDINLTQNGGFTRNNALQIEVKRPFSNGFFLSAGYTWMKNITDVNNDFGGNTPTVPIVGTGGNFNRRERFKSNTWFTPRQQLILTYSWDLPVGRGRSFLPDLPSVMNGIIGGWRVVGVTQFQSGRRLTPFYVGVDPAGGTPGTGNQIPDRVGDGNLPRSQRNPFTGQPFFETAAFVCPGGATINGQSNLLTQGCPLSTPQNVGRFGNSSPTIVEGPGINTWNLSIIKEFKLPREKTSIEFAAQLANPWNHPNWEAQPNVNLSSPATVGRFTNTRNDFIQPFAYGSRKISLQLRVNF